MNGHDGENLASGRTAGIFFALSKKGSVTGPAEDSLQREPSGEAGDGAGPAGTVTAHAGLYHPAP
ncbi:MAG: hypothetical protein A9Z00_08170 [Thermobacillus sp. ZCTH02-B1]|nr:MAG: hypothetical protein A9Z00_08170 [Thermobacillus sp. ZCTH02-B1]